MTREQATDWMESEISDISEDWWCAGWYSGIEHVLWDEIEKGTDDPRLLMLKDVRDRFDVWFCDYRESCTVAEYRAKRLDEVQS